VAQTISYEIVLAFIFLCFVRVIKSLIFNDYFYFQKIFVFIIIFVPLFFVFFISCVVETNRAPFDLAEGESELVSGFNVEYGGLKFALIFLAEYARIIWISFLISLLYFSLKFNLFYFFFRVMVIFLFLVLRASYPRIRYDILIILT
jgi:NADH-ubiquinone oxidoreductase chain 1